MTIRYRLLRRRGYAPPTQQPERSRSERGGEITEGLLHYCRQRWFSRTLANRYAPEFL